jgi:hypothetical protein
MKLTDLMEYLVDPQKLQQLYAEQDLNPKSEALLIYMKELLDINSEIQIFEIEETADDVLFKKNGVSYIQLFPVDYAVSLIELDLDLKNRGYSNLEISRRLLEYRLNDA